MSFRNEHFRYGDMPKPDRRVVLGVLASTFPGADASDKMWRDFYETIAFVRRVDDGAELDLETIVGAVIVTTHPEHQIHSMRYAAVVPDKRNEKSRILRRDDHKPHHGIKLVRYVHSIMESMATDEIHPYHLTIDPYSDRALRFYRRAYPPEKYSVEYDEETNIISVGYNNPERSEISEMV